MPSGQVDIIEMGLTRPTEYTLLSGAPIFLHQIQLNMHLEIFHLLNHPDL